MKEKVFNSIISIITPYYNCQDYIEETAKSVLNQTFPLFEWIIVDDGSSEQGIDKLKEIEKMDKRIKVFYVDQEKNRESGGPAIARDFGISQASETSKYIVFLDADDLYEKTFLECCYWTLETHPEASWTYTDTINFGAKEFLWRKWYNVEWEKRENLLTVLSCIRKRDLLEVGCFGVKEKRVYEDWYLWLKLIKAGKYPIRMNSLLTYYRQKEKNSELKESNTKNRKNAMKLVEGIRGNIYEYKDAIQYPKYDYNWEEIKEENENIVSLKRKKDDKIHVLMIIPWMVTGGADKFNLNLIKGMNKDKFDFTVITTLPVRNEWRSYFEEYATVYDLTTFLEMKDWLSFINYIINKNNINLIFNSNSQYGYKILPYLKAKYPSIPIVDYVHMEEWYFRNGGYSRESAILKKIIDTTFTCNENSRKILIQNFKKKENEVKTVYIGVDEKRFDPEKVEGYPGIKRQNKKIISYICRIADQKRPYLFFEVCKNLAKVRDDFIVVIVGDGPFLEGLKRRIKDEKMEHIFKFIGNIKETEKIYKISDITLNTSIKEGIALTSYESLSMGVPVVSSDVGGQKELITKDVGIIVPCIQEEKEILNFNYSKKEIKNYVNAINKIFDNLEFYKSNCRERVINGFTINNMIKNMEIELENIVKNPRIEKIENGNLLNKNKEILKELISIYFSSSKLEYEWLVEDFNRKNIHKVDIYDKKAKKMQYYEHTLEYKLKHPIVVILRKIGVYNYCKRILGMN